MNEKTFDPAELASRLERSFGAEPPHAPIDADLRVARRRLRKQRAVTSLGGVAVAAVTTGALLVVPGLLPHPGSEAQVAAGAVSDADVIHDCVTWNDHVSAGAPDTQGRMTKDDILTRDQVVTRMGAAELMTRADSGTQTVATVRSGDGRYWIDCTLERRESEPPKAITALYPTAVSFPRTTVGGVRAYAPQSESDPRLSGTATPDIPGLQVTCDIDEPEESRAAALAASRCPTFRLTWNDRRPAEVAKVALTSPDGKEIDADVRDGYLSLSYEGRVTPEIADELARGDVVHVRHITFYDKDGNVLVDDRNVGAIPSADRVSLENFPSLAWWLNG
jgi:hypothetical protein